MTQIWCIIWRFQPLHNGHNLLIETSLKENASTIIFIGSSNIINTQNPYSFDLRKKIIAHNFETKNLPIKKLPDFETDELWIEYIISHIPRNVDIVKFYCGDEKTDSAIISIKNLENTLPFQVKIVEIPRSIIPVSATQIRWALQNHNSEFLKKYLSNTTIDILKKQS
jgi:citrate lyase synthetase